MYDKQYAASLRNQTLYEDQLKAQTRIPYLIDVPTCPFCGHKPKAIYHELDKYTITKQVRCVNPDCPTRPSTKCFDNIKEAKIAWSKRA